MRQKLIYYCPQCDVKPLGGVELNIHIDVLSTCDKCGREHYQVYVPDPSPEDIKTHIWNKWDGVLKRLANS